MKRWCKDCELKIAIAKDMDVISICKQCSKRENILRKYCVQCEGLFCAGDMIFYTDNSYSMFICQTCAEKKSGLMLVKTICVWCKRPIFRYVNDTNFVCEECSERKNMVQTKTLKITAEVDGKQVPLETISTETFEAIKALEKSKEIPVARLATNRSGAPRLLFRPIQKIVLETGRVYALALGTGLCSNDWPLLTDEEEISIYYENIKPL